MSRIYWDTMLFVYWIEGHPQYAARVQEIFDGMERRGDSLCTSLFTVGELLVRPLEAGAVELAEQIRTLFRSSDLEVIPFTEQTAERYASIRASHRVTPADAIHLASAAENKVDLFLTSDQRLYRLVIPGIQFIAGMDIALF